jgi:hypothetical protein
MITADQVSEWMRRTERASMYVGVGDDVITVGEFRQLLEEFEQSRKAVNTVSKTTSLPIRTLEFYADPRNCGAQHYIHAMAAECIASRAELESLKAQLELCAVATCSYAEAIERGKEHGYSDQLKKVLVCRQSLDALIVSTDALKEKLNIERQQQKGTK